MSIDPENEHLLTLSNARTAFPGGKRLSLATLYRWRLPGGVRGIRLETILIGGMRYTSSEAISRFIAAQNAGEDFAHTITPSQRQRQAEAARIELKELGV